MCHFAHGVADRVSTSLAPTRATRHLLCIDAHEFQLVPVERRDRTDSRFPTPFRLDRSRPSVVFDPCAFAFRHRALVEGHGTTVLFYEHLSHQGDGAQFINDGYMLADPIDDVTRARLEDPLPFALAALTPFAEPLTDDQRRVVAGFDVCARNTGGGTAQAAPASHLPPPPDFVDIAYRMGWVNPDFNWPKWYTSPRAVALLNDNTAVKDASCDDLVRITTTIIRADRFAEGTMRSAYLTGLVERIGLRAADMLNALAEGKRFRSRYIRVTADATAVSG